MDRDAAIESWWLRLAPFGAALLAAAAALPGLWFPFLSDDWRLVESVGAGLPPATAYDYFRPLYMASFWLDRRLWGPSPAMFHLTNLILIAACAGLVVIVLRRYTRDPALAALAGVLFALHPYHVENAAWIAVRGDPLYGCLFLISAWSYDRWRGSRGFQQLAGPSEGTGSFLPGPGPGLRLRVGADGVNEAAGTSRDSGTVPAGTPASVPGNHPVRPIGSAWSALPFLALISFEAALLAKESAVVLPVLLVALGILDRSRRPGRREWVGGLAPFGVVALTHFFVLRPLILQTHARSLTPGAGLGWVRHALGFAVAAIVPADGELIAARPLLWGGLALLVLVLLAAAALLRSGRIPPLVAPSVIVFAVLLAPSIVGFQERYLFLPAAAACLALASLLRAARGRFAVALTAAVLAGWAAGLAHHWGNWNQAAIASEHLVSDLVRVSLSPGPKEIVIINAPFRIRGASVAGDFRAAIALSRGAPVPVRALCYVSYPGASSPSILDEPGGSEHKEAGRAESDRPRSNGAASPQTRGGSAVSDDSTITISNYDLLMVIPERPFSHYVGPRPPTGEHRIDDRSGTLTFDDPERVGVHVSAPEANRGELFFWADGSLRSLGVDFRK